MQQGPSEQLSTGWIQAKNIYHEAKNNNLVDIILEHSMLAIAGAYASQSDSWMFLNQTYQNISQDRRTPQTYNNMLAAIWQHGSHLSSSESKMRLKAIFTEANQAGKTNSLTWSMMVGNLSQLDYVSEAHQYFLEAIKRFPENYPPLHPAEEINLHGYNKGVVIFYLEHGLKQYAKKNKQNPVKFILITGRGLHSTSQDSKGIFPVREAVFTLESTHQQDGCHAIEIEENVKTGKGGRVFLRFYPDLYRRKHSRTNAPQAGSKRALSEAETVSSPPLLKKLRV